MVQKKSSTKNYLQILLKYLKIYKIFEKITTKRENSWKIKELSKNHEKLRKVNIVGKIWQKFWKKLEKWKGFIWLIFETFNKAF